MRSRVLGLGLCVLSIACGPNGPGADTESDSHDGVIVDQCPEPMGVTSQTCGDGQHQPGEVCWGGSTFFELQISDTLPYGTTPELLAVDADNDGHVDLITGERAVMGDGTGGMREIVALNFGDNYGALAIDVDNDGVTELAWRYGQGVRLVHGGELFPEVMSYIVTSQPPQDLAVGDFDGDGLPDFMVIYQFGDAMPSFRLAWLRGLGSGEFEEVDVDEYVTGTTVRSGPFFGSDDATDLCASGRWFAGSATGLVSVVHTEYGIDPNLYAPPLVADVTCDTRVDLLGMRGGHIDGIFVVYSQRADGNYLLTDTFAALPSESNTDFDEWIAWDAADLNFDGLPDLALILSESNYESFGAHVAYATGDGTFAEPVALDTARSWFAIKAVDFNEDGVFDLAGVADASGPPTVFGGVEVLFQGP
jgi:hypothetical protein